MKRKREEEEKERREPLGLDQEFLLREHGETLNYYMYVEASSILSLHPAESPFLLQYRPTDLTMLGCDTDNASLVLLSTSLIPITTCEPDGSLDCQCACLSLCPSDDYY